MILHIHCVGIYIIFKRQLIVPLILQLLTFIPCFNHTKANNVKKVLELDSDDGCSDKVDN
jgi:hypothetical protein